MTSSSTADPILADSWVSYRGWNDAPDALSQLAMTASPQHPGRPPEDDGVGEQGRAGRARRVKGQILEVAAAHFRRNGYDRTSLADVGAELGLTRGAVLYHFRSKPQLIADLLEPFTTGLERALDEFEAQPPNPEAMIDRVLDLLIETRSAVDLLARDIASRHAVDLDAWFTTNLVRLVRLLAPGSDRDRVAEVRGYAVLGCLIRPLAELDGPVEPAVREAIHDAALGALGRPSKR